MKQKLVNKNGMRYSDVREMVFDAVHLLNPKLCRKCQLQFDATKSGRLGKLLQFGFSVAKYLVTNRPLFHLQMQDEIVCILKECKQCGIPFKWCCSALQ